MSTSTTALVRSSSSGSSTALHAPGTQPKSPSPSTTLPTTTAPPRRNSTPQSQTTPAKPSNPQQQQQQQQPSPAPSTPGKWQHPRMDEILRRQNRTKFDPGNVSAILYNLAFLLTSIFVPYILNTTLPTTTPWLLHNPYTTSTLHLTRAFFLLNIFLACAPLFRKQDTCEDIPLTPAQRNLLGLPPMSRPATPQEREGYVTPPRYSRSNNTPRNSGSGSGSSLHASPSTRWTRSASGSPLSSLTPGGGGVQIRGGGGGSAAGAERERRKLSYTSTRSSPLSMSEFFDVGPGGSGSVNTPTAKRDGTHHHRASVGLNSKWLYEKGKAANIGGSGRGWGTGSVFT